MGHVRYPTAGTASVQEAQPFFVNSPLGMYLIHNGNITNTDELKVLLNSSSSFFNRYLRTDSDSEVLFALRGPTVDANCAESHVHITVQVAMPKPFSCARSLASKPSRGCHSAPKASIPHCVPLSRFHIMPTVRSIFSIAQQFHTNVLEKAAEPSYLCTDVIPLPSNIQAMHGLERRCYCMYELMRSAERISSMVIGVLVM